MTNIAIRIAEMLKSIWKRASCWGLKLVAEGLELVAKATMLYP
jgi:hypothetical protein